MTPKFIVIHDSDSRYGNSLILNSWHLDRGFKWVHGGSGANIGIGYHYVLLNGKLWSSEKYYEEYDGVLEIGRPESVEGAHCRANGRNGDSIGVCFIGPPFSPKQVDLGRLFVRALMVKYDIPIENVRVHKEEDPSNKTDPRFDMDEFRSKLKKRSFLCGLL